MNQVAEAGRWLAEAFGAKDYQTDSFPALAEAALKDFGLTDAVSIESVLSMSLQREALPMQFQAGGSFGQPPVTLYWDPSFVIDAYFWHTSTTSIHEHGFAGAFAVASGSSLQAKYRFDAAERFGDAVWTGELVQTDIDYLKEGDVRSILPGDQMIHSVFHLASPSLSICIRTGGRRNLIPVQRNFSPVGLGVDPFFRSDRLTLLPRIIGFGLEYQPRQTMDELRLLVPKSDALELWKIFDTVYAHLGRDLEPLLKLIDRMHPRHNPLKSRFRELYPHRVREQQLVQLRHTIEEQSQRKALGLLLNAHSLDRLRDGIRALFGDVSDVSGVGAFTNVVNAMGFKDGTPNMEAVVAGFGFGEGELRELKALLESPASQRDAVSDSLKENLAFGKFFKN